MAEYRAQLDAVREEALAKGRNRPKRKVGLNCFSFGGGRGETRLGGGEWAGYQRKSERI